MRCLSHVGALAFSKAEGDERRGVCDKFVGNDRSNEPRRGEIFIVQNRKKMNRAP